ncbi:mycofactocin biosynthesis glycosyltransferase MftF [Pseudonocardia petroleophila]|uniref:Mycofactocin biosynthesis glycosyltransferase MftF n=1 Tax=Pseudonocardia petroleophila TaxID=37331 RepID=A0A7G7MNK2_9PSEU|nr:mycofactocin biosynthesis glycosyltransferase MftF [Pseudonocardia petroleophila]QNG54363.1 mycofactocin biosynthesis glycosyltransferase MftF [Pseudonocardia petroleophila]
MRTPGPADTALPDGVRVTLDRRTRSVDDGAVLLGGAPPRMLRLAAAGRALLSSGAVTVDGPTSRALARRLLDVGIAHPVDGPPGPGPGAVTVVVPVKDRVDGLQRLVAALGEVGAPGGVGALVVVDDGSADPAAIRAAAGPRATVLRHGTSRGASAARNTGLRAAATPLVAFLDSDVVPEEGWLAPLLAVFADPAVGLAAPRIVALAPVVGWLGRYEAVHSSLDLGPDPALIVPRSRVAYVPSAAMVVRRDAAGAGFDEDMHVAEDVDLVLRLHADGWRLRYAPGSRVAHDHRTTLGTWWWRKAQYGTGAAPLALRHHGSVPPMVLSPTSAAVAALALLARPWAVAAAGVVGAVAVERLSRRLDVRHPRATAARLVGLGSVGALSQTADAVTRHYWPLSLVACAVSRRARRRVLAIALAEGALDWWRHRDRDARVRPDPASHVLAHRLDDLAYGAGLWWGAAAHRTAAPLRPSGPSVRVGPNG